MRKARHIIWANKFKISILLITLLVVVCGSIFYSHRIPRAQAKDNLRNPESLITNAKNIKGEQSARVTIVEFSDLECLACAQAQAKLNKLIQRYPNDIRLIYRHYPLKSHKNSRAAAISAEAAAEQDQFFEMIDLLYKNQGEWTNIKDPTNAFATYADELNLNIERFMAALKKDWPNIESDYKLAKSMNLELAPTIFINGIINSGVMSEADLEFAINSYIKVPEASNTSEIPDQ